MYRVGEFEKVSFSQFFDAMKELIDIGNAEETTREAYIRTLYEDIVLPERKTKGSAGYDFHAPFCFHLPPCRSLKIPTGIRVKIEDGWWLGCLPRSSLGFKYRMQLDNTMGVIDQDYYYSDNEGHIFIKVTNDSIDGREIRVNAGDSFAQGIFLPYGVTYSDNAEGIRNGGMGSTGK